MKRIDWIKSKILTEEQLSRKLALWRFKKEKIVFTNGCFDLLHAGHATLLAEASEMGDILIVALNSDVSVKRLKGAHRPFLNQQARAFMLASLHVVDAVIIFEEDTPQQLIEKISPDVLVKGGDYRIDTIVGADWVLQRGGAVKIIPLLEGYSTTALAEKLR